MEKKGEKIERGQEKLKVSRCAALTRTGKGDIWGDAIKMRKKVLVGN